MSHVHSVTDHCDQGTQKRGETGLRRIPVSHTAGAALRLLSPHILYQPWLMLGNTLAAFLSPTTAPVKPSASPRILCSLSHPSSPSAALVALAQGRTMQPVQGSVQPRPSASPSPSGKSGAE